MRCITALPVGLTFDGVFLLQPTYYEKGPMDQSNLEHLQRTCKNCPLRPTTQSAPDSQTARPLARNTASGCNAAPFHGRHTASEGGRVGEQFRICWFRSSVCPIRYSCRTKPGCRPYQSSLLECRFGAVEVVGLLSAFAFGIGPVAYLCQGFVAGGAVGFTGLEDEGGLAVKADDFGDGLSVAKVGEEREGDGRREKCYCVLA